MASVADLACGTRADAMWHTRPCGRAAQAHVAQRWLTGGVNRWQGYTSPRGCPGGTTWRLGWQVKGPQVSGPSLDSWGGNANALRCPRLYTRDFSIFLPCGTLFPWTSDAITINEGASIAWTRVHEIRTMTHSLKSL